MSVGKDKEEIKVEQSIKNRLKASELLDRSQTDFTDNIKPVNPLAAVNIENQLHPALQTMIDYRNDKGKAGED